MSRATAAKERIGARAVGWYDHEVQEWIRHRDQSRDASGTRERRDFRESKPGNGEAEGTVAVSDGDNLSQRKNGIAAAATLRRGKTAEEQSQFSC